MVLDCEAIGRLAATVYRASTAKLSAGSTLLASFGPDDAQLLAG
ncbi:MAG: hypothetical protein ACOCY7_03325 [Halodesulfurarchaeum sp.]